MSGATSYRSARGAPGALPYEPARVSLDGWGQSPHWTLAHYLRGSLAVCEVATVRRGLSLLGSLKGRRCCTRCLDALGRGAS